MKKEKKMGVALKRLATVGLAGGMLWYGGAQTSVDAAVLKDVFDEHYYADQYEDLKEAFGYDREALWNHYMQSGLAEGRVMNELFDVVKYRQQYADLSAAFGDNWDAYINHYVISGAKEGRDNGTGNAFDAYSYAARYSDLQEAFGDDVLALWNHYKTVGAKEGREAHSQQMLGAGTAAPEKVKADERAEAEQEAAEQKKGVRTERLEQPDGKWSILEYDANDKLIMTTGYRADGQVQTIIEYNADGKFARMTTYAYSLNGTVSHISVVEYYADGKRKKTTGSNPDGSYTVSEYDESGNQTSRTIYNADGSVRQ